MNHYLERGDFAMNTRAVVGRNLKTFFFVVSFFAVVTGADSTLALPQQAHADEVRTFELRIYHAIPGKLQLMEERFRDKTSIILKRHGLNVIGYWENKSDNLFIFMLRHESKARAADNWRAFAKDPDFQKILEAEEAEKTLDRSEIIWLQPMSFSHMK